MSFDFLYGLRELALFAGVMGGQILTHRLLDWRTVGYVEREEYACKVLEARINDGLLSPAPILQMHTGEFIRSGLAEQYRGVADVVTAGFPCQPFSNAGQRAGNADERNGWPDTIRIIDIVQPEWVFLENVRGLLSSVDKTAADPVWYFGTILRDLAGCGYDAAWRVLSAAELGAPHQRDRLWIVAHAQLAHRRPGDSRGRRLARQNHGLQAGWEKDTGWLGVCDPALAYACSE